MEKAKPRAFFADVKRSSHVRVAAIGAQFDVAGAEGEWAAAAHDIVVRFARQPHLHTAREHNGSVTP